MNKYTPAVTATIASGASLSGVIDLGQGRAVRVLMPASWDAANLTVQVSYDGVNFNNLYDSSGNEYTITAAASRAILLNLLDFIGVRYLKLRSGTNGTPVNQTAARTLTVMAVPE